MAYSETARRLAQELARKAAANLRRAGWTVTRDRRGRWRANRPATEADAANIAASYAGDTEWDRDNLNKYGQVE